LDKGDGSCPYIDTPGAVLTVEMTAPITKTTKNAIAVYL
jgi:hypothetical protein